MACQDRMTGHSRGFGFLVFETAEIAEEIIARGPHAVDRKTVSPRWKRILPACRTNNTVGY